MSDGIGISISLSKCIFNLTQLPYIQPKKPLELLGFSIQLPAAQLATPGHTGELARFLSPRQRVRKQRTQFHGKEAGTSNPGDAGKKEVIRAANRRHAIFISPGSCSLSSRASFLQTLG